MAGTEAGALEGGAGTSWPLEFLKSSLLCLSVKKSLTQELLGEVKP